MITVTETKLPGVVIIEPKVFHDQRGFFLETYNQAVYEEAGIDLPFVQDNHSRSSSGVLRGLHYQLKHPQGKLVAVLQGKILDVIADIRLGSPTFGQTVTVEISEEDKRRVYVPPGYAHGFCVLSDTVDLLYKCTDYYHPEDEYGVAWNDPALGLDWPLENPILSAKDQEYVGLADKPIEELPVYEAEFSTSATLDAFRQQANDTADE